MIDIGSPEALMARQLASQQTGFAIAGPGPVQTDLFPILEYAAPPALYFGDRSRMLDRYDERTRQQLLAPGKKRALLHSLSLVNAQIVFNGFSTINGELYGCLFGNSLGAGVPCAFQTPNPAPPPEADGSLLSNAEHAFAAGNLDQAAQFAALALQQKPGDEQARYISRVIERKRSLEKTALKNTSQKLAKAN
jgi:hypothetical protein